MDTARPAVAAAIPWTGPLPPAHLADLGRPQPLTGPVDLTDAALDPLRVRQGVLGDCWFVSALMALVRIPPGRDLIRRNVRWDPAEGRHHVRLYVHRRWREVPVEAAYGGGARVSGAGPGWVGVYEAALATVSRSTRRAEFLRIPAAAFGMIAGRRGRTHPDVLPLPRLSPARLAALLAEGRPVTTATAWKAMAGSRLTDVPVHRPDGAPATVRLVPGHSYCLTRVTADGRVVVVNPHGPGNRADGGGELVLEARQWHRSFVAVAVGRPLA